MRLICTVLFVAAVFASTHLAAAEEWTHLWGSDQRGSVALPTIAEASTLTFDVLWKRPLGSGYSSVTVSETRAFTMASEGASDWLFALDRSSGAEVFRVELGEAWLGRSGSRDGPMSTPTIHAGTVYALGPFGNLLAVNADSGDVRWQSDLAARFEARTPGYGFSTSPLVVDDLLIVQIGNPARDESVALESQPGALVALKLSDGELVWRSGYGEVETQVPLIATLAGRRQIVTSTAERVFGLDPESGNLLWQFTVEPRRRWTMVSLAGPNELVVAGSRGTALLEISQGADQQLVAMQRWDTNVLRGNGQNSRMPIYRDGYLYAHTGKFLSCVDARDGSLVWRSRPPGGETLIEVGGHLMMLGADGALVAARTLADGYQETGRITVFGPERAHTPPTAADGILYVRNLSEVAAVAVSAATAVDPPPLPTAVTGSTRFQELISEVSAATDKRAAATRLLAALSESPWLDDGWLHFLFQGPVEDLVIQGDITGFWPTKAMSRIPGTELFYAAFQRDGLDRVQYRFHTFDEQLVDARNDASVELPEGEFSVWTAAEWSESEVFETARQLPDPATDAHTIEIGTRSVEIHVVVPAAVGSTPGSIPLVLIPQGDEARSIGLWNRALARLYADGELALSPAVFAFLSLPDGVWYSGGVRWLGENLKGRIVQFLNTHYPATEGARSALVAQGETARNILQVASDPTLGVDRLVLQSPYMDPDLRAQQWPVFLDSANRSLAIWIGWGSHDGYDLSMDVDIARDAEDFAAVLREREFVVEAAESPGGFGWLRWREELPEILKFVLAP